MPARLTKAPANRFAIAVVFALIAWLTANSIPARCQETRGTIIGIVRDVSGAVVPGASVQVTNTGTSQKTALATNEEGFFSLPYLVAGEYRITVSAPGFKTWVQDSLRVTAEGRHNVNAVLAVGAVSEQVTVEAQAVAVDSASATGATVLNRELSSQLPLYSGNANMLVSLAPGVHYTSAFQPIAAHDIRPQGFVTVAGGVGFPEFAVDGIANRNEKGRISYAPHTDTVEEVKVDAANFDASQGHTSNTRVSVLTKSGTNQYHGALNWQHWQQRWNATPSLVKTARADAIAAAVRSGNTSYANELRNKPLRPSGRSNTYSATLGGPVLIPKLLDGHNKLFFFFGLNGYKENKTVENFFTVPSAAQRDGDFSNLLKISQPIVIYDPRTSRREGARVVRDPFPNNQVPVLNPAYGSYARYYPLPNSSPRATEEGINNYFATAIPQIWDFKTYTSRMDWYAGPRHRIFGRWHWSNYMDDSGGWAYEVVRGLSADLGTRKNWGGLVDYVFTMNATTIFSFSGAYSHYEDGNIQTPIQINTKAADVGLPKYLDEKAGDYPVMPHMGISGYATINPGRRTGYNRYTIGLYRGEMAKSLRSHAAKLGFDIRDIRRCEYNPTNTTGSYSFGNDYTRRNDQSSSATTSIGLAWAAFMMGVPSSLRMPTRAPSDRGNLAFSIYLQDDWRITWRLTLNLGLRFERENGATEVQNRFVNYFNPTAVLPISEAGEKAYLTSPIAEKASIIVRGGSGYAGIDGAPRELTAPESMWMPRVGFAYQLNKSTVLRAGYGLFYDSYSALDFDADNRGYTRETTPPVSDDLGLTFNNANLSKGITLMHDPFPIRSDGTRFNLPVGNKVGLLARAGQSFTYTGDNWRRPRQQRWRTGVQYSIFRNTVVEAAYMGSFTQRVTVTKVNNALPKEWYSTGMVRDVARENDLNTNIKNPFNVANFGFLQQQNPYQYQELSSNSFFTSSTIRKHQLLRPFPHMVDANDGSYSAGKSSYHHLELSGRVRARLFQGITSYVYARDRRKITYDNPFDTEPIWLNSNSSRPHTFKLHGVLELPFGKGRRYLSKGLAGALVGGWQLAPGYIFQSGEWVTFGNAFWYGKDLATIRVDDPTPTNWFNTADFERDRDKQPSSYHVRVFPRSFGLRANAAHALDANASRVFPIKERVRLQFRADFLNALNKVQWAVPSTDPTNTNFGMSSSQRNTPRVIQFQARLSF